MSAAGLLRGLRDRGAGFWVEGEGLRYRGSKQVLTPEVLEDLKAHKPDILRLLTQLVNTPDTAGMCLAWLETLPQVALDIETCAAPSAYAAHYTLGRVRLITFAHAGTVRSVDVEAVDTDIVRQMLLVIADKPKFLHGCMFDLPRLHKLTSVLLSNKIYDTLLASKTARAGEWTGWGKPLEHGLDAALKRELGKDIVKDKKLRWGEEITERHLEYAADDVVHLERLHAALVEVLAQHSVLDRYEAVRATLPTFLGAAVRGVPIDVDRLDELTKTAAAEEDRLLVEVRSLAPEHPDGEQWVWKNKNKPDAVDKHGNRIGRNGALRALSLLGADLPDLQTDSTLVEHRDDHPLIPVLRQYYKAAQEYSQYRKWIPEFQENGRLYPQAKVAGAVTGRVLYGDPNVQGINKQKGTGEYRKVIRAAKGMSLVTGDFAQQELRVAAYFSQDAEMYKAFESGDFYTKTAEKMVGRPVDKKDPARAGAKRATLGFLYGLGIAKYRDNVFKDYGIKLSEAQANRDREAFRATFPGLYAWQREYGSKQSWTTRSVLGWRRHVAPGKDRNGDTVPKYTDRINGPIQSTAGDILYLAIHKMQADWDADIRTDAKFLVSVHDEIVLECPEESAKDVALWLHSKMREAFEEVLGPELGGPKSVEVSYGPSWGEQEELKDPKEQ